MGRWLCGRRCDGPGNGLRPRESLILKAQETLAAVHEVREWIGKQSANP